MIRELNKCLVQVYPVPLKKTQCLELTAVWEASIRHRCCCCYRMKRPTEAIYPHFSILYFQIPV